MGTISGSHPTECGTKLCLRKIGNSCLLNRTIVRNVALPFARRFFFRVVFATCPGSVQQAETYEPDPHAAALENVKITLCIQVWPCSVQIDMWYSLQTEGEIRFRCELRKHDITEICDSISCFGHDCL
jgi:hypothetical protein